MSCMYICAYICGNWCTDYVLNSYILTAYNHWLNILVNFPPICEFQNLNVDKYEFTHHRLIYVHGRDTGKRFGKK